MNDLQCSQWFQSEINGISIMDNYYSSSGSNTRSRNIRNISTMDVTTITMALFKTNTLKFIRQNRLYSFEYSSENFLP